MSVFKKVFLLIFLSLTGILVFSFSAFAVDEPSGDPGVDYPVEFVFEPSEIDQYGFLIYDGSNFYYFYFNVVWADNYGPNDIVFFPYFCTGWSSTKSRIAVGYFITNSSITSDTLICTCQGINCVDTVSSSGTNLAGSRQVKGRYNRYYYLWDRGSEILDTTISDTFKMQILLQTNWAVGVYHSMVFYDNLPSQMYSYDSLTSTSQFYGSRNIVLDGFYYEFGNGLTNFHATDSDFLLTGTSNGTITDSDGNVYNITNTYEFDMSPFTESDGNQPDPWDNSSIDDYNSSNEDVQDSISDFKGQFAFSDVFGEDFDLTSFRGAMTFWKDRFDEVMDFNPVFPVLITTSLTLGLVAVILGRKLGVG